MLSRSLLIDGHDAWAEWGVYVTRGGWADLIAWPALKAPDTLDWPELDGIEADLTAPVLDSRDMTVEMATRRGVEGIDGIISRLSDGAYHTWQCPRIGGRAYRLRLTEPSALTAYEADGLTTFTLKLADDAPLDGYTYQPPQSAVRFTGGAGYAIDGRALTAYGLAVLRGTLAEIERPPAVKTALKRTIKTLPGAIYDAALPAVVYKSKDIKLACLLRAETLAELWRNYDALLYDLTRPGERTLTVAALGGREIPCYYKSAAVTDFYPDDKIWLSLTITLTVTRPAAAPTESEWLLITEGGTFVTLEDGTTCIDLTPLTV